ncbi:MAG TPA: transposase [Phycisphaerae bacterium]|nr:transposase [Phycisphaerae bacterium]
MAKRIVRGKDREAFWRGMVQGQASSRLSVRAYCRRHDLHESAFYAWRRKLARRGACTAELAGGERAAFVPVRVSAEGERPEPALPGEGGLIEIVLADGRRVAVVGPVDREALAAVLSVLEGGRSC